MNKVTIQKAYRGKTKNTLENIYFFSTYRKQKNILKQNNKETKNELSMMIQSSAARKLHSLTPFLSFQYLTGYIAKTKVKNIATQYKNHVICIHERCKTKTKELTNKECSTRTK